VLRSDPTLPSTSPLSCEWAAEGMASTARTTKGEARISEEPLCDEG
jgi:hypothetical protein